MKIAICDDCNTDINYLRNVIKSSVRCPIDLEFCVFSSGEVLMENFEDFDAIFLDMHMSDGMNGIETAKQIRKQDPEALISFFSSFETPASKIVQLRPFDYLVKNFSNNELALNIDNILKELAQRKDRPKIQAICDGNMYILQLSDIVFISIAERKSILWLTKKKAEEIWDSSKMPKSLSVKSSIKVEEYYSMLKDNGFIYANKSYIVNAEHIIGREKNSVLLSNGCNLNVSRGMKKAFDNELSRYLGVKPYKERIDKT